MGDVVKAGLDYATDSHDLSDFDVAKNPEVESGDANRVSSAVATIVLKSEVAINNVNDKKPNENDMTLAPEEKVLFDQSVGLVKSIARRYASFSMGQDELQHYGYIGLLKAIKRFDSGLGFKFVSFAVPCISGEILRGIRDFGDLVKLPKNIQDKRKKYNQAVQYLESKNADISTENIAAYMGESVEFVRQMQCALELRRVEYLDAPAEDRLKLDGTSMSRHNMYGSTDENFEHTEYRMLAGQALSALEPRLQQIVALYFGLCPYDKEHTQTEIAGIIGVSQVQVSRLLKRAVTKMAETLGGEVE